MKNRIIIIIKKILNNFGIDIVRGYKKSVKTKNLSFHKTKTGNYWLPRDAHSDHIANAIKENRIFDKPIFEMSKIYIKSNSTVLDIGSNFGQMSILFSKLVGDKGSVYAFEADDFIYSILEKNCKENSSNIIPNFGAVHNESNNTLYFPEQDFDDYETYGSYGIDYVSGKGRPVKTLAIDDIDFKLPISFIKIDIQGGDLLALKGAIKTIKKYKCPILFEYEYLFEEKLNLCFQDYVDFVNKIDYHFERVIMGNNFLILPNKTS